jgi:hypothetical protein
VLSASEVEGFVVLTASGDRVGVVAESDDDRLYVEPDPGALDAVASKLGWMESQRDAYPIDSEHVATVGGGTVTLRD